MGQNIGIDDKTLEKMCAAGLRYVEAQGVKHPDYFIAAFLIGEPTVADLESLFRELPEGVSEMCFHPSLAGHRMQELAAVRHFNRHKLKDEFGIEMVNYTVL